MKNRILYLDVLKILAILFVIYNHTHMYVMPFGNLGIFIRLTLFSICKVAVPLFIMTSGALLLNRKTSYKKVFTKRIVRVFIAYVISCIFFCIFYKKNPLKIIFYIWSGGNYNYIPYWGWYIYMLIGLYIVLPFLQKMLKGFKEKDYKIFILLFVIIASFMEFIPSFSSAIIYMIFKGNINYSLEFNNRLVTTMFSIAIGYFVFGHYMNKKKISKKENYICIITFIITNIINACYLFCYYKTTGDYNDFLLEFSYLPVAISSMCLFTIFKYYLSNKKKWKFEKFITISSSSVFGIYLFHVPLIGIIHDTSIMSKIYAFNSFVGAFSNVIIVFIILDILFYLIRKIPIFKKIF